MTPITCTTTSVIVVVVHVIGIIYNFFIIISLSIYHFNCYNHDHNHCQGDYHDFLLGKSEITGHIPVVGVPVIMLKILILKMNNKAP